MAIFILLIYLFGQVVNIKIAITFLSILDVLIFLILKENKEEIKWFSICIIQIVKMEYLN